MKQFLMGLSVSAAFIVGCVTATVANNVAIPQANSAPPQSAERWENRCEILGPIRFTEKRDALLGQMGEGGWQLVTVGGAEFCFKRRLK